MKNKKYYKIYYGNNSSDYVTAYLKESDIIDGCLTESKAFEIFFNNQMILCNNYIKNNHENLDELTSLQDEEGDYIEEYQIFIVDPWYSENIIISAVEKMGNTLYYDCKNDIYILGVSDFGSSRTIIATNLKVEASNE